MGAQTKLTRNDFLPLFIDGNDKLLPMKHIMKTASAQVKSALILAALNTHGKVKIVENSITRDHTEKLLQYLNLNIKLKKLANGGNEICLNGPYEIRSKNISIASDPSSAAFFIVGALIVPGSEIKLINVCLNPTRIAFIDVLKRMGGKIKIERKGKRSGENIGNIIAKYSKLKGIKIQSRLAPLLIDEYPILSIAATQADGTTVMKGLGELRYKESDRLKSIVTNLNKLNFEITSKNNDIYIKKKQNNIKSKKIIKTYDDHRIAMSFLILNILYPDKIAIDNEKCISISYPKFKEHLKYLLNQKKMTNIIAIDGPASAGKSAIAKRISHKLKAPVLFSGRLYRAVAVEMINRNISYEDNKAILKCINRIEDNMESKNLYTSEVDRLSSIISTKEFLRDRLKNFKKLPKT